MAEYTWKNLIYNPTLEEAKNAIGKECYFGYTPIGCIKNANDDKNSSVLREVRSKEFSPFITSNYGSYSCIIVKKEEPKPKYVPFKSAQEFLERYTDIKERAGLGRFNNNLLKCGMWIRLKDTDLIYQVSVITDKCICLCGTDLEWSHLNDFYEFLDGTPCGKEVKDE